MTNFDILVFIEKQLFLLQQKYNFNPDLGKKQIRNHAELQCAYGRFEVLKEIANHMGIGIPYDPSGSGHAHVVGGVAMCYVYFIHEVGSTIWKIGSSTNPHARLMQIRVGNPHDLHIKYLAPGGLKEEKTVQSVLKKYHIRGEWYDIDNEDIVKKFVKDLEEHGK